MFERVNKFVYLGSLATDNWLLMSEEIKRRIKSPNKYYYGLQKYFKSRLLT